MRKGLYKKDVLEKNNALEGFFWPLKKRFSVMESLFQRYRLLTPFKFKPFHKSFTSFKEYEAWTKKQTNPWYR